MNKSSEQWVSKWNLTPVLELDALDLNWKTHGLIFCILLSLFTLIFFHYSDIFRCQIVSCRRCFRRQQNSRSVNLKTPEYCEKPEVKTCSPCKEGFMSFPPYDRPLRPFVGDLGMSFSKYGYAIVWREILLRACTSRWSQLFVARLGSINFVLISCFVNKSSGKQRFSYLWRKDW